MLGLKIKQYLTENGIKQAFLVEKTGLSANVISDICKGNKKTIDAIVYFKICRALGVDLAYFLTDGKESEL
ncbi:MAG: helix-turn-helix transcriptional regulator [Clostridia bacterium]|nr:helix-turn-helix transcriptional regulator [Clostridia bacterium]